MSLFKKKKTGTTVSNTMLHKKLDFAATEAYKLLRTNVMFTLPDDEGCRVIGVASTVRNEGKSTTAINLSYTLAETGKRVLLIDADLRLPTIAKKLELKMAKGLSNVLIGEIEVTDAVMNAREEDENWKVLQSGDIPPNPTEMLGSAKMKNLIASLRESYDFIILDLPPVNIVSDALVVSPVLDGVLIVIREDYSTRRALNSCMKQLSLSSVKVLGFVFNTVQQQGRDYGRYRKYFKRYHRDYRYDYNAYHQPRDTEGDAGNGNG